MVFFVILQKSWGHSMIVHIAFFNWNVVDIQCYIGFRYTTQSFDNYWYYSILTPTSAVAICQYKKMLQNHWLYSPCCTTIPMANLYCDWECLFPFPWLFLIWQEMKSCWGLNFFVVWQKNHYLRVISYLYL